eukprot:snap_masked-scaffold_6-processed-gene-13.29-mRNA-1 protein AED:1.00 eAED:1.00 QI:0/-1/0/0/-1/1/1/0/706
MQTSQQPSKALLQIVNSTPKIKSKLNYLSHFNSPSSLGIFADTLHTNSGTLLTKLNNYFKEQDTVSPQENKLTLGILSLNKNSPKFSPSLIFDDKFPTSRIESIFSSIVAPESSLLLKESNSTSLELSGNLMESHLNLAKSLNFSKSIQIRDPQLADMSFEGFINFIGGCSLTVNYAPTDEEELFERLINIERDVEFVDKHYAELFDIVYKGVDVSAEIKKYRFRRPNKPNIDNLDEEQAQKSLKRYEDRFQKFNGSIFTAISNLLNGSNVGVEDLGDGVVRLVSEEDVLEHILTDEGANLISGDSNRLQTISLNESPKAKNKKSKNVPFLTVFEAYERWRTKGGKSPKNVQNWLLGQETAEKNSRLVYPTTHVVEGDFYAVCSPPFKSPQLRVGFPLNHEIVVENCNSDFTEIIFKLENTPSEINIADTIESLLMEEKELHTVQTFENGLSVKIPASVGVNISQANQTGLTKVQATSEDVTKCAEAASSLYHAMKLLGQVALSIDVLESGQSKVFLREMHPVFDNQGLKTAESAHDIFLTEVRLSKNIQEEYKGPKVVFPFEVKIDQKIENKLSLEINFSNRTKEDARRILDRLAANNQSAEKAVIDLDMVKPVDSFSGFQEFIESVAKAYYMVEENKVDVESTEQSLRFTFLFCGKHYMESTKNLYTIVTVDASQATWHQDFDMVQKVVRICGVLLDKTVEIQN